MDDKFRKIHLVIDTASYEEIKKVGLLKKKDPELHIQETQPTFENFYPLLSRVGGPWGWNRRPKYIYSHKDEIAQRLIDPATRLFLLKKNEETIGYCLVTAYKDELSYTFNGCSKNISISKEQVVEIENFGLFMEHTGQGYGQTFLPQIFDKLFENYKLIYLSTRSTNHPHVVAFYESLGMHVTLIEEFPNDLLPSLTC